MKKEKYIGYSVDELLENPKFVNKVNNIKSKDEWDQFLQANTSSKEIIIQAKKIIQLFETSEKRISAEKNYNLWKNISSYNTKYSTSAKSSKRFLFVKIAASVLLIIALGSSIYFGLNNEKDTFEFSETSIEQSSENPFLLLANGTKVEIADCKNEIVVLKNRDAVLINDDSLISNVFDKNKAINKSALNEINVPYGKETTLLLADGTKVWLNAGSRFAFPQEFKGNRREVRLDGEAYFEVAKNADMPFIVYTAKVDVEVLGTKFNLSAFHSDDFCETVLLEGAVNVTSKGKMFNEKVSLLPNQKATYKIDSKELVKSEISNAKMYISWIDGWYQFSNEELTNVLQKLERYYAVEFVYDDLLNSKALPVSGKLELKDSIKDVMGVISKVVKIDYKIADDKVFIGIKKNE